MGSQADQSPIDTSMHMPLTVASANRRRILLPPDDLLIEMARRAGEEIRSFAFGERIAISERRFQSEAFAASYIDARSFMAEAGAGVIAAVRHRAAAAHRRHFPAPQISVHRHAIRHY